jgi:hypothetical protein
LVCKVGKDLNAFSLSEKKVNFCIVNVEHSVF